MNRSRKKSYGSSPGVYIDYDDAPKRKNRRSLKQWLRDYLKEEPEKVYPAEAIPQSHVSFAKSFEGWNIRLHRANGGHIVEAWKNEDGPMSSNYKPPHELFMVQDSEDMGERLNSILVQLMLRG
jgi:hypothetical protein